VTERAETPTPLPLPLRLRMELPALREAERKVVQALLAHMTEVSQLGVTSIARLASVSEASVMRLCRSFGFRGFSDFKVQLIRDLAIAGARPGSDVAIDATADVTPEDDVAAIALKVFRMDTQVLADTLQILDMRKVEESIEAIAKAGRVEVFGIGGSALIAQDAAYRLIRVGIAASAIPDPHMQAIRLALMTPHDVVIGISHTGETRDTVEGFALAVEAGACTIAVTSASRSSMARMADIALVTSGRYGPWRGEAIPPRIVQLAVMDTICVALDMRKGVGATSAVDRIDRALQQKRTGRRHSRT
jgi:RpiR family carbohydrate utilization transcriptional regulator